MANDHPSTMQSSDGLSRRRIEPYWYVIGLLVLAGAILYGYNLITGETPSRVAFHVAIFNFDIYWYGILIVGGIAVGSWVVSRLAMDRARWVFEAQVPPTLRQQSVDSLDLPEEIGQLLNKRRISTIGELLLEWGLSPSRLGVNRQGEELLAAQMLQLQGIEPDWVEDPAWHQWNPDFVWSGIAWCLIFAVIGARIYHILTPSPSMAEVGIYSVLDYLRSPLQMINLRNGGLGIYGGLIGGAVGLILFTRRHRISAIAWADLAVVGLALGQAIGRWGNFFNQELYGRPTDLPWAVTISPLHRLPEYVDVARFHPAFLYESLWSLLTFFVLYYLARRQFEKLQIGDLFALYLVFYAVGRILVELVRLDSRTVHLAGVDLGLPVASLVSVIVALPMAALLIWRHLLSRNGNLEVND